MAVDDHGWEVLKKSGELVTPGDLGDMYIKTRVTNPSSDPVQISGAFTFSGLSKEWKVTTIQVTDTAVKIPTTSLTDRNSLTIKNVDDANNIYLGPANTVTAIFAIGNLDGLLIPSGEDFHVRVRRRHLVLRHGADRRNKLGQAVPVSFRAFGPRC